MKEYTYIPTYEECLATVEECDAFSHSTQELNGHKVESFKYNLMLPGMWDAKGRINMRGITFVDGVMQALPFPKFFNLGEHESTTNIDFSTIKGVFEKVDGSLISVFSVDGELEIKTMKSIESDVAIEARQHFKTREDIKIFSTELLKRDYSPIFEYVSPLNRIVIEYAWPDFYYLGCRNMLTGEIHLSNDIPVEKPNTISAPTVFTPDEMKVYLEREDVEGVVVVLESGLMFKMKTEAYCRIHKVLDHFSPKKVVENIVNGTYDDMIGVLSYHSLENEVNRAKDIFEKYAIAFEDLDANAVVYHEMNKYRERKDIAIELMSTDKLLASLVFKIMDGKDHKSTINKHLLKESKEWTFDAFCEETS